MDHASGPKNQKGTCRNKTDSRESLTNTGFHSTWPPQLIWPFLVPKIPGLRTFIFVLVPQVANDRKHMPDQITAQHSTNLTPDIHQDIIIQKQNRFTRTPGSHVHFLAYHNKKQKLLLVPKYQIAQNSSCWHMSASHSKLWILFLPYSSTSA